MSFNLYFAGSQALELDYYMKDLHCMRLFTYADGTKCVNKQMSLGYDGIFIDSGAYSIARRGATVNIDEYVQFINSTTEPKVFASLDAIPFPSLNSKTAKECSEKSWENYLYIYNNCRDENKHKILPVYHFGEPIEYLDKILNTEVDGKLIDYMGLGGGNAGEFFRNINYYTKVFDMIKKSKNPNIKVHAFGMTVPKLLEMFPFYSADSTTWLMVGVNGNIILDNGKILSISSRMKNDPKSFWNLDKSMQKTLEEQITAKGFDVTKLGENYKERLKYNVLYFKTWADNYKFRGYKPTRKRLF